MDIFCDRIAKVSAYFKHCSILTLRRLHHVISEILPAPPLSHLFEFKYSKAWHHSFLYCWNHKPRLKLLHLKITFHISLSWLKVVTANLSVCKKVGHWLVIASDPAGPPTVTNSPDCRSAALAPVVGVLSLPIRIWSWCSETSNKSIKT